MARKIKIEPGIYKSAVTGRYFAYAYCCAKTRSLGGFRTLTEARKALREFRRKYREEKKRLVEEYYIHNKPLEQIKKEADLTKSCIEGIIKKNRTKYGRMPRTSYIPTDEITGSVYRTFIKTHRLLGYTDGEIFDMLHEIENKYMPEEIVNVANG